ncbi:MAG TPA: quinolinate synthase NadA [Desulfobacteria bacterium]|nr:quinolinate synthase NadA [Desulfobacteria bacterium]
MYAHQEPLASDYLDLSDAEFDRRIQARRQELGAKLVILGHHYQRDEVIQYTDFRGDSLQLSQLAAKEREAAIIIFCGVHFMAETADILTSERQKVILPDLNAGCAMADMAELDQVEECWSRLKAAYGKEILPITYVNSSAEIKAFCGRNGGLTCTSSNAEKVMRRALLEDRIILFLPDEHLGRNTAAKFGIPSDEIFVWLRENPDLELPARVPRLVLWNGFCTVHQRFTPAKVDLVRKHYPGIKVIVHPECEQAVVEKSDLCGSTEYIIRTIEQAPAGSEWAVGTEINLVHRLASEHPEKRIVCLNETVCLCASMYRIDRPHLLWTLDNLAQGKTVNRIVVPQAVKTDALQALNRMLKLA